MEARVLSMTVRPRISAAFVTGSLTLAVLPIVAACSVVSSGLDLDSAYDAGTEAAVEAGYCATHDHTFCDDFDTSPLGDPVRWTRTTTTGLATTTLAPDRFVSAPRSLVVEMPAELLPEAENVARLEKDFALPSTTFTCAARIDVSRVSLTGFVIPLGLRISDAEGRDWIEIDVMLTGSSVSLFTLQSVAKNDETKLDYPSAVASLGTFSEVALRIERQSGGRSGAVLLVDGADVALAATRIPSGPVSLQVGLVRGLPGTLPWQFAIDDVRCDFAP